MKQSLFVFEIANYTMFVFITKRNKCQSTTLTRQSARSTNHINLRSWIYMILDFMTVLSSKNQTPCFFGLKRI